MAKIWAKDPNGKAPEGKYLVLRRDASVLEKHFVLGARDPYAVQALISYANAAELGQCDPAYVASIRELAKDFVAYRLQEGNGDPDAGPHRKDDPDVIAVMRGANDTIYVRHEPNARHGDDA